MDFNVSSYYYESKFWFYFRKGLFQVFFPILLGIMSFCDFIKQKNTTGYDHLYFYTSLLLIIYASARYIMEFIFSICSEEIIFKKKLNSDHNALDVFLSSDNLESYNHFMITTKKIFRIRYSRVSLFIYIDKICWVLGIESPLLISQEIIDKLSNNRSDITEDNEEIILHSILLNLSKYNPQKYNIVPIKDEKKIHKDNGENDGDVINYGDNNTVVNLLPCVIITKLDKSINELQKYLFNKKNESYVPNV